MLLGDEASHQKLQQMVEQLSHGLTSVKHEQEYMEVRERIHRQSESMFQFIELPSC